MADLSPTGFLTTLEFRLVATARRLQPRVAETRRTDNNGKPKTDEGTHLTFCTLWLGFGRRADLFSYAEGIGDLHNSVGTLN